MTSLKSISENATSYNVLVAVQQTIAGFTGTWIQHNHLPDDEFLMDITLEELKPHFLRVAQLTSKKLSGPNKIISLQ